MEGIQSHLRFKETENLQNRIFFFTNQVARVSEIIIQKKKHIHNYVYFHEKKFSDQISDYNYYGLWPFNL